MKENVCVREKDCVCMCVWLSCPTVCVTSVMFCVSRPPRWHNNLHCNGTFHSSQL